MAVCTKRRPGLLIVAVGVEDVGGRLLPEHDVQLRESENESVALVDEDDVDVVAELFGESGGQL